MREPKKVRDSARGEQCCVRLPGVCSFDPETTVFAHISKVRQGHGMGIKTDKGSYACSKCHDVVDSRAPLPKHLSKMEVVIAFYEGVFETQDRLFKKGLWIYV